MKATSASTYFHLIYKNIQLKYKQTMFGFFWSLLQPALYLFIFVAIFSHIFQSIHKYPLYILSGLLFFVYFSEGTNRLCLVFLKNASMIKSIGIPKSSYAITELGSEMVNFMLGLVPFLVIMYFMGLELSPTLLYIIPILLLFTVFIYSIGTILGSLNVFFRDIAILWSTLNPALFYLSPIAYSSDLVPADFRYLVYCNPLFHFLQIIRDVLYLGQPPSLHYSLICIAMTAIFFVIALLIYRVTKNSFISNL
ncbi:MAG TPA: ABC transporter permease [Bacteroidales bacterium]|nr:ABC transporter permease [Bacteroidales bacterium]